MRCPSEPLRLALLAFTIFPAALAINVEEGLQKRQGTVSASTSSSTSHTASTTSSLSTTPSTQTSSPSPSSTPPSSTPIPSATSTPGTTPSVTSSSSTPTPTPTIIVQTITSSASKQIVTTLMSTDSSGSTIQQVLTTSGLVAVGTSVTTSTSFPNISGGESSGSSGLSSQQKKIIIGVVVGVGGFVILGGMALVAWRVWGRKKQPLDDDPTHAATPDARPGPGGTPFKSTLDQYHNPGTVNTASNF
ncbi:MAG: hypothetical protein M1839_008744 [Geoglossum umbratile]|nr:MAG: hypothetical protein M1839_008744 [Geoglossum umbratile]